MHKHSICNPRNSLRYQYWCVFCHRHAAESNCFAVFQRFASKFNLQSVFSLFMLFSFQNAEEFIGRAGLVMIVIGMVGSITFGIILDKTHKFK